MFDASLEVVLESRHIGAHRIQVEVKGPTRKCARILDSKLFFALCTLALLLSSCLFSGVLTGEGWGLRRGHGL